MKDFIVSLIAGVCVLSLTACSSQPANTHDADVKAIQNMEDGWNQQYAAKDYAKATSNYAADAEVMYPGMAPTTGKPAIEKVIQTMVTDPAFNLTFKADRIEVAKSGDIAFTQGSYTMSSTDPATHKVVNDRGSYVTGYKKAADGTWKAVSDIAVSSVPAPAPPAHAKAVHKPAKKH